MRVLKGSDLAWRGKAVCEAGMGGANRLAIGGQRLKICSKQIIGTHCTSDIRIGCVKYKRRPAVNLKNKYLSRCH
ncbi:hypothetical protein AB7828_24165 [Tardiphaga sp. 215_C5_N2_1]|uniref:hypothetical protein n=1 Tax=Tardiphaga sp. 215_C5_N2_1 TaxID=3240774 RepID=UPI003F899E46